MNNLGNNFKKIIDNSVNQNKIHHCYLLKSNHKIDLNKYILYMLNTFNNSNFTDLDRENLTPNIQILNFDKSGKDLQKDSLISYFEDSNFALFSTKIFKIYVIYNIEQAHINALNAILKTIESPSQNVIFIFTTDEISKVLNTIKSRSLILNIYENNEDSLFNYLNIEQKIPKNEAWLLANLYFSLSELNDEFNLKYLENLNYFFNLIMKKEHFDYSFYNFFINLNKKDNYGELIFYFNLFKFILYLTLLEKKETENKKINKVVEILLTQDRNKIQQLYLTLELFFEDLKLKNLNIQLLAEKTLIKLMEIYG
ncbi:hypothetical protein ACUZ9N_02120 [Mycoplasmopsis gallinarum]